MRFGRKRDCDCGGRGGVSPFAAAAGAGRLPGGLIGVRTVVGRQTAEGVQGKPVLRPGWTYQYQRREKILHAPTVPPPIPYSLMHPVFIGPGSGVQGYVNTGPSSYFNGRTTANSVGTTGGRLTPMAKSWPYFFSDAWRRLIPPTYNRTSAQAVQGMGGPPAYGAVLNVPYPNRIPTILQPRGSA